MSNENANHGEAESKKEIKKYTKPVVIASTQANSNFSAGCATKTGYRCMDCRCS